MDLPLGGFFTNTAPNLWDYPALDKEVVRLRLGAHSIGDGMEKVCLANGFEYIGHEEIVTGYKRINALLEAKETA